MFQTQVLEKIETHIFIFNKLLSKFVSFMT